MAGNGNKINEDDVNKVISIINNNPYRPLNSYKDPGGLIDISENQKSFIVIGDLHGSIENLNAVLEDNNNKTKIKNGETFLIIVGDGVHNDQTGEMLEMKTSMEVLDKIFELFLELKENLFYIKGNHDSFDERLAKSGIQQGLEFKKFLLKEKGEYYVEAVSQFFESLPQFIIGPGFVVTHAGPIRRGATKEELINIVNNSDFQRQLMWNRVHEFRGTPSLKEYDGSDIKKMLEKLSLPPETYFIVGHNPLWRTGNTTGIWQDVTGIKNHIIIISNRQTNAPYLFITQGSLLERFAIETKTEYSYDW